MTTYTAQYTPSQPGLDEGVSIITDDGVPVDGAEWVGDVRDDLDTYGWRVISAWEVYDEGWQASVERILDEKR